MNKILLVISLLLSYLYMNTGVHSDDYIFLYILEDKSFLELIDIIFTSPLYLKNIIVILFDFLQFHFFEYNFLYYDIIKIFISFFTFFILYVFSQDYMSKQKALLFSLIFIIFPIHDATNYWIVGQYLMITLSLIIFSHYLIQNRKFIFGFGIGILGAFASYSSLPFSFGLSVIFILQKEYKKFVIFILPQIIYIIYYFIISKVFNTQAIKGSTDFSLVSLTKQYILQVGTFIDASIGPSFWIKIYYSIMQVTTFSIIIGVILVGLFYKYYKIEKEKINKPFLIALVLITLFAFGIFALTGMYPQIAFNLGNRVTIYGSLFVSFLVVMLLMNNKKSATVVFAIFIFSVLGLSDHWKSWNKAQLQIIDNIKTNKDIQKFDRTKQLFVTYNQYSKLGDLSHIEFFAQGMATHIFKLATKENYQVSTLNRRFIYKDSYLLDKKYDTKINIDDEVYVYDSKANKLLSIKKEDIQEYIDTLPKDNRHWIQLFNKDNFIMKIVLKLMPRLEYAL